MATNTRNTPSIAWPIHWSRNVTEQDDEEQVGERVDDVHDAHQERVPSAAEPAGDRPHRDADEEYHDLDHEGNGHTDLGPVEQEAQVVATEPVRAEEVARVLERRERLERIRHDGGRVLDVVRPGRDQRAEDRRQQQEDRQNEPEHRQPVAAQPAERVAPDALAPPGLLRGSR